jgi:outer membrane protein
MKGKLLLLIVLSLLAIAVQGQNKYLKGKVTIGVVVDGEWDLNQPVIENLKKEIKEALSQQAAITIPDGKVLVGDWTLKTVSKLNDRLLNDNEVDIIIGFGVLASYDLARRNNLPKPVIAPVILDTTLQKIKSVNGTSGVKNLSYLVFPRTFERDIELFKQIVNFKNLVVLQSKFYLSEFKNLQSTYNLLGKKLDINIKGYSVGDDIKEILNSIPVNCDAVYISVLPIDRPKIKELINGLNERRLPTFSLLGEMDVRDGVMAGANPDIFPRLERRIALIIQRILLGEDAGILDVGFPSAKKTFINLQTAFAVGVSPKYNTLLEADIIGMTTPLFKGAVTYSLDDVIKRLSNENLDVLAKVREVAANYQNISLARSNLLPQIDVSATGLKIDEDRALAGSQPENKIYGDARVSQIIFSEPVLANLSIQNSLYNSKLSELEAFKQNTILDGSKLFINYLRTRKIFDILLENLKLLRVNLDIAQKRESIGAAGPEEPLRWEAEVAGLKKSVMDVQAQMNQLQLAFKQMLNIPMVYLINIEDVSTVEGSLSIFNKDFQGYLEDPLSYDLLTDYLVNFGLKKSADMQMLEGIINAKERSLTSTKLSRILPTISLFGSLTKNFYKSDIKSPFNLSIPAPPPSVSSDVATYIGQILSGFSIPLPNDVDWNIGINASLNIFSGMRTTAQIEQTDIELMQLKIQERSLEEKIALGIRSEMENLKAKNFGLAQSRIQVEAADKALKIVSDSYSRGAVSILFLLDAQTAALNAQQISANALYDLFISYIQLQRAVGQYYVLMTKEERDAFMNDMVSYISKTAPRK